MGAIPRDIAWQLCAEIRRANRGKWYTYNGLWCWGCVTFNKNVPAKMCVSNEADYRGCGQVDARYDRNFSHNV